MSDRFTLQLGKLRQSPAVEHLAEIGHGIEKESLRIDGYGKIAQSPHPQALGSALTHPYITTDFAEALLEFITPVCDNPGESLAFLEDLHAFVYEVVGPDEFLWTSSMPGILGDESNIAIADYGKSNSGRLKTLYRVGLSYRYGRPMQTIAGIHYNFSLSESFWRRYQELVGSSQSLQDFKTEQYFHLIRNFRRYSWLLIYLFGASPALNECFAGDKVPPGLERYDDTTLFAPYGTALRMGDLGYTSQAQMGLFISYNTLEEYLDGLARGISTPSPPYESFRGANGEPAQVNSSLLQIENEFYSTIRPKRVAPPGSRPLHVLRQSGVEYIEVRCLDLNPFLPVGIDEEQIHFLDSFLIFCLLRDSPPSNQAEYHEINLNLKEVVNRGRDPELRLRQGGKELPMREWANSLLEESLAVAELLDNHRGDAVHTRAVEAQRRKVADSELTPSAKILARMQQMKTSFIRFGLDQSLACSDYFRARSLSDERREELRQLSEQSLVAQQAAEAADDVDFDTYLARMNSI